MGSCRGEEEKKLCTGGAGERWAKECLREREEEEDDGSNTFPFLASERGVRVRELQRWERDGRREERETTKEIESIDDAWCATQQSQPK